MGGVRKLLHGRIGEYIFFGDYKSCIIKRAGKKVPDIMIHFLPLGKRSTTLIAVWAWKKHFDISSMAPTYAIWVTR